jgi:hypothetical protein
MEDHKLEDELYKNLRPGETVLWSGKPKSGLVFRGLDIFLIPFSFLWCGFALFWEFMALYSEDVPFFFALFGIPFVLIGLNMAFFRFITDANRRKNTIYGITEHRILIISGASTFKVNSLEIKAISHLSFKQKKDKTGSINFSTNNLNLNMQNFSFPGSEMSPSLELISDVKNIYNIILDLQRQNRSH